MTETQLLENVLDACATLGARTLHIRPARTEKGWRTPVQGDGKGWPDLYIVTHDFRVLIRELKGDKGRLTLEQRIWLTHLNAAGQDIGIWRPRDWPDRILREIRGAA